MVLVGKPERRRPVGKPRRRWVYTTKESSNRPGVAQRVPGGLGCQISMTFGT
jgi:hypothetical protein